MKKIAWSLCICAVLTAGIVWAFASGGAEDPLVSLDYLQETFSGKAEGIIEEKLDTSDDELLMAAENGAPVVDIASTWQEVRLKEADQLQGTTGTGVIVLAGDVRVNYGSGTVVDVTSGTEVASGTILTARHRYMVAEDTTARFEVQSRTAVLNYQGQYSFIYSDAVDYNAMAVALKKLNLFRGSNTGYGQGFDLEVAPTRLQAIIMFIRVLGEEEEALAWSGEMPFTDVKKGTQAERYIGYAYSKGYTNGYTKTEFRPTVRVNAKQYAEFMLRAMGYSSAENTKISDALIRAQAAGVLTEGEVALLQGEKFLRAHLVYVSYYALDAVLPDGTQTLGDVLIEKDVFTAKQLRDAAIDDDRL